MDFAQEITACSLVFLDLETTGLNPGGHAVCEVGAVRMNRQKIQDEYCRLVNPGRNIPHEVYSIHGISNDDVRGAPAFWEMAGEMMDFLSQPNTVICAYNAPFDISFIDEELNRAGMRQVELPVLDVLAACRDAFQLPRYSLKIAAQSLGVECRQKLHRARQDVMATAGVFWRVHDALREKGLIKLGDWLSLYGWPNGVWRRLQEEKTATIQDAIEEQFALRIKYFSRHGLREEDLMPTGFLSRTKNQYVLFGTKDRRISLGRILRAQAEPR